MGVMIRSQGQQFVVTSDRVTGDQPSKSAPKRRMTEVFRVWTGDKWSMEMAEAKTFQTSDQADEYVRVNSKRIMELG